MNDIRSLKKKAQLCLESARTALHRISDLNYGKVSMGVVRTTYLIDEEGVIIRANDKVKAAEDPEKMLEILQE